MNTDNDDVENDDLKEGRLYKVENGQLIEIQTDASDLKKIKVTDDAFDAVKDVQVRMKTLFKGHYKPEIVPVASAMLVLASQQEQILEQTKAYIAALYQ